MSGGPKLVRSDSPRLALAGKEPPEPPLCASLIVIHGERVGRKFDLDWGATTIGRSETNGICLDQDGVSRTHATIVHDEHGVVIRDHGSSNGTYVNEHRIEEAALESGDLIGLGRTILRFVVGDDVESAFHEELYRLSTVDGLTQVFNRRYFVDALASEVRRARQCNDPLSVIVLDIDHFRRCNETFGHKAGDVVLCQFADSIRRSAGEVRVVARWGGEELAIILPGTVLADAAAFGETIRRAVEDTRFGFDEQRIPITISVGVAELESSETAPDDLVGRAVARLESAKEPGRNRVVH